MGMVRVHGFPAMCCTAGGWPLTPCVCLSTGLLPFLQAVLRSLQHLQLDAAMLGLQCGVPAAARFIGALTTLRSLTVRGRFMETCNHWRVLRKESFVPLQQLTQLDLPDWVAEEAPTAGAAGASS